MIKSIVLKTIIIVYWTLNQSAEAQFLQKSAESARPKIIAANKMCHRTSKMGESGYCSKSCQCGEGEGCCQNDNECMNGLRCQKRRGKYYGFGETVAVCVRDESQPSVLESSGKFEGDIEIETSKSGINLIVETYGREAAQEIVNQFPGSARQGAAVKPVVELKKSISSEAIIGVVPHETQYCRYVYYV